MPKMVQIILSLSIVSLVSGLLLAGLHAGTKERIEISVLKNKQMPAVEAVLEGADNNLLEDRRTIELGKKDKRVVFPAKKGGEIFAVALESSGKGFGGNVGVMLGIEVKTGNLTGIGITTMSETPGVGTRAKDNSFTKQFKGMSKDTNFKVKADGGDIDAVSGATVTSRAVCEAIRSGMELYGKEKAKIDSAIK